MTKPPTLDDFAKRIASPLYRKHLEEVKRGGVTPERIREMAREAVPDPEDKQ